MKLHEFAKKSGVTIVNCEDGWGGKIGYTTRAQANVTTCGFDSIEAAYTHWLNETFGEDASREVRKLFEDSHE